MGSEWQYKGEGNANIVFSYCGSDPSLQGYVLRVRKQSNHPAQRDAAFIQLEEQLWSYTMSWSCNPLVREASYKASHIAPVLGQPHVHIGQPFELPDSVERYLTDDRGIEFTLPAILLPDHTVFGRGDGRKEQGAVSSPLPSRNQSQLSYADQALAASGLGVVPKPATPTDALIPQDRAWHIDGSKPCSTAGMGADVSSPDATTDALGLTSASGMGADVSNLYTTTCTLGLNSTAGMVADVSNPDTAAHTVGPCVCVEIKPKCGFLPSSHAICPDHILKHFFPRYFMHQLFKYTKGKVKSLSGYNPLDLFSQDPGRMAAAVMALLECPQNNLRVFESGVGLYGGKNGCSSEELEARLQQLWLESEKERVSNGQQLTGMTGNEEECTRESQPNYELTESDREEGVSERQGLAESGKKGAAKCQTVREHPAACNTVPTPVPAAPRDSCGVKHCEHGLEQGLPLDCSNTDRHENKFGDGASQHAFVVSGVTKLGTNDSGCDSSSQLIGKRARHATDELVPGQIRAVLTEPCVQAKQRERDSSICLDVPGQAGALDGRVSSTQLTANNSNVMLSQNGHGCMAAAATKGAASVGLSITQQAASSTNAHGPLVGERAGETCSAALPTLLVCNDSSGVSHVPLSPDTRRRPTGPLRTKISASPIVTAPFRSMAAKRKLRRTCVPHFAAWVRARLGDGCKHLITGASHVGALLKHVRLDRLPAKRPAAATHADSSSEAHAVAHQHSNAALPAKNNVCEPGQDERGGVPSCADVAKSGNVNMDSTVAAHEEVHRSGSSLERGGVTDGGCNAGPGDEPCGENTVSSMSGVLSGTVPEGETRTQGTCADVSDQSVSQHALALQSSLLVELEQGNATHVVGIFGEDIDSFTPPPSRPYHSSHLRVSSRLSPACSLSRLGGVHSTPTHGAATANMDYHEAEGTVAARQNCRDAPGRALLTRVICQTLQETRVMERLLALQSMDVWDVEGIAIILERLLQADAADLAAAAAESASLSISTAAVCGRESHPMSPSGSSQVPCTQVPVSHLHTSQHTCAISHAATAPATAHVLSGNELQHRTNTFGNAQNQKLDGLSAAEHNTATHQSDDSWAQLYSSDKGFPLTAYAVSAANEDVATIFGRVGSEARCEDVFVAVHDAGNETEDDGAIFGQDDCAAHNQNFVAAHALGDYNEDNTAIFENRMACSHMKEDCCWNGTFLTAHAVRVADEDGDDAANAELQVKPVSSDGAVDPSGPIHTKTGKSNMKGVALDSTCGTAPACGEGNDDRPWPHVLISEGSGDVDGAPSSWYLSPRGKVLCQEDVLFCPMSRLASVSSLQLESRAPSEALPRALSSEFNSELNRSSCSSQILAEDDQRRQVCVLEEGLPGNTATGGGIVEGEEDLELLGRHVQQGLERQQDVRCHDAGNEHDGQLAESNHQYDDVDRAHTMERVAVDDALESSNARAYDLPCPSLSVKICAAQPTQTVERWGSEAHSSGRQAVKSPFMRKNVLGVENAQRSPPTISLPCSAKAVGSPRGMMYSPGTPPARLSSSCPSSPSAHLERVNRVLLRKPSLVTHETAPRHAEALQAAIEAQAAASRLLAAASGRLRRAAGAAALRQHQHAAALERIEHLTLAQCLADLRGYLIAATAKDCGIMVTVQQVRHNIQQPELCCLHHRQQNTPPTSYDNTPLSAGSRLTGPSCHPSIANAIPGTPFAVPSYERLSLHPAEDAAGSGLIRVVHDSVTGLVFECKVSFVDLDLKPLSKVLQHLDLDTRIVEHTLQMLPYITASPQAGDGCGAGPMHLE